MPELLLLNDSIMPLAEGRVRVEDRGFQFADGIYEFVRVYDGAPFALREHLERWEASAAGIMLESPGSLDDRTGRLLDLIAQSGIREGGLYGQLTRGAARRLHTFPDPAAVPPTELWYIMQLTPPPPGRYENGVALISHPDERWAWCCYKTISLLPNCIAKERARRAGALESVFFATDGAVSECAASNVWCVRDGVASTPPLGPKVLPGITRAQILQMMREAGEPFAERTFTLEELRRADEVFITSTTMEIVPVVTLDSLPVGTGKPGPVTRKLGALFATFARERAAGAPACAC